MFVDDGNSSNHVPDDICGLNLTHFIARENNPDSERWLEGDCVSSEFSTFSSSLLPSIFRSEIVIRLAMVHKD